MNPVVCRCVLQFEAGPGSFEFCACQEHREGLARGNVSLFYRDPRDVMKVADEEDGECVFCRGEEGP